MTSSIKPEVYNVSLYRQRRTEPQVMGNKHKKFGEDRMYSSEDMIADRHTHTHTNTHIHTHTLDHNTLLPNRERTNT